MGNTEKNTILQEQILRLAAEANISIEELTRRAGLSASAIRSILYGHSKNPRHDTLKKIAKALNISVSILTGEETSDLENEDNMYNAQLDNDISNHLNTLLIEMELIMPYKRAERLRRGLHNFAIETGAIINKKIVEWYLKENQ